MRGLPDNCCTSVAFAAVVLLGTSAISLGTNGGKAWTSESARRLAIEASPYPLPTIELTSASGKLSSFKQLPGITLFHFIFTTCPTICNNMGAEFNALQQQLSKLNLHDVQLISITFDNEKDDLAALDGYLSRFHANTKQWDAVKLTDADLSKLLEELQVIVIPDARLGFVHNSAIYVTHHGSVVAVKDYDQRDDIINLVVELAVQS